MRSTDVEAARGWLRAGVFEGGIVSAIEAGTPQGSPISPLLANVALHSLDEAWQASGQRLGVLAKYADDLVALCATREQAEEARELVAAVLDPIGLRLHPEKTRIVHLAQGAEGFDFLGFHHRMRKSWRTGYWYLQKWPSDRAMTQIKGKIRDRTGRRYARLPLEYAVENLNRVLRGWGNYFRYGNSGRKFLADRQLRPRTPREARQPQARTHGTQLGHPLQPRVAEPARRLPPNRNGETHDCVCQSVNDVGEPCAGEPHARFDAAAGGNPGPVGTAARSPKRLPPTLHRRLLTDDRGLAASRLPDRRMAEASGRPSALPFTGGQRKRAFVCQRH